MPSEPDIDSKTLLKNRVAILRDVRLDGDVRVPKGSLGLRSGDDEESTFGVRVDRDGPALGPVPANAAAHVDADGRLPGPCRVSIAFAAVVGSRAQGLASDASDTDRRGFYVASPQIQFGLESPPPQLVHDADQLCFWEVEKFLKLALKANPTVLETLYSPVVEVAGGAVADELSALKRSGAFLSKRARHTFMGYADAQFDKMSRARAGAGVFKWRHAMHLIRLLRSGVALMQSGDLSVVVPPSERAELLAIKRGEESWDRVCRLRERLAREFRAAAEKTPLPDEPSASAVNSFLVNLRVRSVEEACR